MKMLHELDCLRKNGLRRSSIDQQGSRISFTHNPQLLFGTEPTFKHRGKLSLNLLIVSGEVVWLESRQERDHDWEVWDDLLGMVLRFRREIAGEIESKDTCADEECEEPAQGAGC